MLYVFFFQAEDGIRDLVRSRGLGDVYKRQHRDTRRDRKASTIGWTVSRVTKLDIDGDLVDAVRDVAIILRRQGWAA